MAEIEARLTQRKMRKVIYKIIREIDWTSAVGSESYEGSEDDQRDGYIHFSTASQLKVTSEKYFAGQQGLLLVAFDETALGSLLKWEPSRGGDLFPHLYGSLDPRLAIWSKAIPLDNDGELQLPAEARQ